MDELLDAATEFVEVMAEGRGWEDEEIEQLAIDLRNRARVLILAIDLRNRARVLIANPTANWDHDGEPVSEEVGER